MKHKHSGVSRRDFMKAAMATGAAFGGFTILGATAKGAGKSFKIGLVGCGGRGKGAVVTALAAAKQMELDLKVAGVADYFQEAVDLAAERFEVPKDRAFVGIDAYKKLLATDIDIVVLATPPVFRPIQFEAAVKAGKQIFMEKPAGIDPAGIHRVIAAGEEAAKKGLTVVAGTQRRHAKAYLKTKFLLDKGAIGKILGGCVWWCQGPSWFKDRLPGEDDRNYMIRNWMNFAEMAGDHIVEQHVHNIDVANWMIGSNPVSAVGFGGRARRKTGNTYDFFSIDFEYPGGVHVHSMCRQISGCWNFEHEFFIAEKGKTYGKGGMKPKPEDIEVPEFTEALGGPYVNEHADLLAALVAGKPINEARTVAESTLCGIMGRISAYTGQMVKWDDVANPKSKSPWANLQLKPCAEDFEAGQVTAPKDDVVPIPGKD